MRFNFNKPVALCSILRWQFGHLNMAGSGILKFQKKRNIYIDLIIMKLKIKNHKIHTNQSNEVNSWNETHGRNLQIPLHHSQIHRDRLNKQPLLKNKNKKENAKTKQQFYITFAVCPSVLKYKIHIRQRVQLFSIEHYSALYLSMLTLFRPFFLV